MKAKFIENKQDPEIDWSDWCFDAPKDFKWFLPGVGTFHAENTNDYTVSADVYFTPIKHLEYIKLKFIV